MTNSVILMIIFISFAALIVFLTMKKTIRNRNINRHEQFKDKQEEILQMLREKENKESNS